MSKIAEQLHSGTGVGMEPSREGQTKLDPFEHKPEPTFWQLMKGLLTFDRMVIFLFVAIAALVLTYRSGIHQRVKSLEDITYGEVKTTPALPAQSSGEGQNPAPAVDSSNIELPMDQDHAVEVKEEVPVKAAEGSPKPAEAFVPYLTIQAVSYAKKDRAEQEVKWLADRGYEALMLTGKTHFVVCVGKFDQKAEAKKAFKKIMTGEFKSRYKDAYVRPVKKP